MSIAKKSETKYRQTERKSKGAYKINHSIIEKAPFGVYVVNEKGSVDYVNSAMLKIFGSSYVKFKSLNMLNLPVYKKIGLTKKIKMGLKGKSFKIGPIKYSSYLGKKTIVGYFTGIPFKEADIRKLAVIVEDVTEFKQVKEVSRKDFKELERRIKEQNAKLVKSNASLKKEITEREKAEDALRENEERLKILLDSIQAGIIVIDIESRKIVNANPMATKIIGLPKEQIIGFTCYKFICASEAGKCPIIDFGQTMDNSECELIKADGSKIPIIKTATSVVINGRRQIVEIFIDITERKRMEQLQLDMVVGLRAVLAITDKLIASPDVDTLFRQAVELARDELRLERCAIFIEEEDHMVGTYGTDRYGSTVDEHAKRFLKDKAWIERLQVRSPQEPRWTAIKEPYIEWDGEKDIRAGKGWVAVTPIQSPYKIVGVFVNDTMMSHAALDPTKQDIVAVFCSILGHITERIGAAKEVEMLNKELLESNKQLKQLAELKSEFASTLSHELRTPLTAMKEGIDLVLDGSTGAVNKEQKEFLGIAKRNADRLGHLINNVLIFSKLTSYKGGLKMEMGSINELIESVTASYKLVAEKKGFYIYTQLEATDGFISGFDSDRISQVMTNLIDNAIKFTNKGSVGVFTAKDDKSNSVKVCVEDTGTGIRKNDISKLFQSFVQLRSRKGRKPGGTGLGLAICKEIIKQSGGKIWVESEFGKGSKFCFILPVKERRRV